MCSSAGRQEHTMNMYRVQNPAELDPGIGISDVTMPAIGL